MEFSYIKAERRKSIILITVQHDVGSGSGNSVIIKCMMSMQTK